MKTQSQNNHTIFILSILCFLLPLFLTAAGVMCAPYEDTTLEHRAHTHPRIYFTDIKIKDLRDKIHASHKLIWQHVKEEIDNRIASPPSELPDQNQMRIYGETLPYFAVGYLMTQDTMYLHLAKEWLFKIINTEKWADEQDLGGSHMVYGISLVYDWLYHEFSEDERANIRNRLIRQVDILRDPTLWWKFKALQNHLWINTTAIATAGFALYGEVDSTKMWIQESHEKLLWVLHYLSPDGSSPEGMGYAQYGTAYLLKYFDAARDLLGAPYSDPFFKHSYFRNAATFFIYNFCPRNVWGTAWKKGSVQLNWGDSKRYPWYGPDYLFHKFAIENNDTQAQWFARELISSNVDHAVSSWLSLLWYNPDIIPIPPTDLPTFHHFNDIDIVVMRSDWSNDESLLFFKCSPAMGHHFYTLSDSLINMSTSGNGHAHYDANSFMIHAEGEWLAIDPGYTNRKLTRNHNTVIVNGKGMINDGEPWAEFRTYGSGDKPHLKSYGKDHIREILRAESTVHYDYVIGDASRVYNEETRLTKYLRHILYLKPDCYLIIDELEADTASTFEWLLHAEDRIYKYDQNRYVIEKNNAVLQIQSLSPADLEDKIYVQSVDGREITEMITLSLSPKVASQKTHFITLLHSGTAEAINWPVANMYTDKNALFCHIQSGNNDWHLRFQFDRTKPQDRILCLQNGTINAQLYLFIRDKIKERYHEE